PDRRVIDLVPNPVAFDETEAVALAGPFIEFRLVFGAGQAMSRDLRRAGLLLPDGRIKSLGPGPPALNPSQAKTLSSPIVALGLILRGCQPVAGNIVGAGLLLPNGRIENLIADAITRDLLQSITLSGPLVEFGLVFGAAQSVTRNPGVGQRA